ncbi:nucleoside/nucleotide kinase family protein [Demequina oxidasica]|uniref:nucleoside/nucleotide kinase family protein n=1 Tax=Demequina oxidasica TaxID=676199 RepID=UPI000786279F|nr:nucleoside/nucleotide kinase family protein [Demequina oxidasica]
MPSFNDDNVVTLTCDEFVERARTLLENPGRTMLGVVGPPGSGKSTLTTALGSALGDQVVVVPMDGFHLANERLVELGRRDRKGAPDTFDVAGYVALLRRIRDREELVYAPRFDREIEQSIGSAQAVVAATPLVVTEGNYLLSDTDGWPAVRELLDEVWYIDVELDEVRRRLEGRRVGHGHEREAARNWVATVDVPNAQTVIATRDGADLIIRVTGAPPTATQRSLPQPEDLDS